MVAALCSSMRLPWPQWLAQCWPPGSAGRQRWCSWQLHCSPWKLLYVVLVLALMWFGFSPLFISDDKNPSFGVSSGVTQALEEESHLANVSRCLFPDQSLAPSQLIVGTSSLLVSGTDGNLESFVHMSLKKIKAAFRRQAHFDSNQIPFQIWFLVLTVSKWDLFLFRLGHILDIQCLSGGIVQCSVWRHVNATAALVAMLHLEVSCDLLTHWSANEVVLLASHCYFPKEKSI